LTFASPRIQKAVRDCAPDHAREQEQHDADDHGRQRVSHAENTGAVQAKSEDRADDDSEVLAHGRASPTDRRGRPLFGRTHCRHVRNRPSMVDGHGLKSLSSFITRHTRQTFMPAGTRG
jgi:hypothetical protein